MWMLEPGSRKTASPSPNRFAVGWKRFAVAMEEGRGPKRGPCANMGCKNPDTSGGQWNWLPPPTELAGFDLREDAVCRCNKRACQEYFRGEKRRKLKEAMFQGGTNDPCLPKQYKVKKVKEIWGIKCARAVCRRIMW